MSSEDKTTDITDFNMLFMRKIYEMKGELELFNEYVRDGVMNEEHAEMLMDLFVEIGLVVR